jgi:hypothetical protein
MPTTRFRWWRLLKMILRSRANADIDEALSSGANNAFYQNNKGYIFLKDE